MHVILQDEPHLCQASGATARASSRRAAAAGTTSRTWKVAAPSSCHNLSKKLSHAGTMWFNHDGACQIWAPSKGLRPSLSRMHVYVMLANFMSMARRLAVLVHGGGAVAAQRAGAHLVGVFLPRSRRHEPRVSMKFLCRRGGRPGSPRRRGGGKRHIVRRADVTWKPCRILMLRAAAARPVVSCRFHSRPIMLHVQAVGRRVKKLRKKASLKHVLVTNSAYASPCRPSAVVRHRRHGGYM